MGGYLTIKNMNQLHLYFIFVKCVLDFKPNLLSGQTARVETKESRVKRVKSRNLVHQQENNTSSCYDISFKHFLSILPIPLCGCVSTLFPLYLESSRPLPPLPHTRSRAREKKAGNLTRLHISPDFILAYFKKSLGFYSGIFFPKGGQKKQTFTNSTTEGEEWTEDRQSSPYKRRGTDFTPSRLLWKPHFGVGYFSRICERLHSCFFKCKTFFLPVSCTIQILGE